MFLAIIMFYSRRANEDEKDTKYHSIIDSIHADGGREQLYRMP